MDGGTVDVDIDLGNFGVWLKDQLRVRLYGVNATVARRDLEEKKLGLAAKDFCKNFCKEGETGILKTKSYDLAKGKYGRILGEIWSGE